MAGVNDKLSFINSIIIICYIMIKFQLRSVLLIRPNAYGLLMKSNARSSFGMVHIEFGRDALMGANWEVFRKQRNRVHKITKQMKSLF